MKANVNELWDDLVAAEPGLDRLYTTIVGTTDPGGRAFCAETLWHTEFKPRLLFLAGFRAQNPRLRNRMSYEVALDRLYAALPPCRGCACCATYAPEEVA
jgi:hypothetical protein